MDCYRKIGAGSITEPGSITAKGISKFKYEKLECFRLNPKEVKVIEFKDNQFAIPSTEFKFTATLEQLMGYLRCFLNLESMLYDYRNISSSLAALNIPTFDPANLKEKSYRLALPLFYNNFCFTTSSTQLTFDSGFFSALNSFVHPNVSDTKYVTRTIPIQVVCNTIGVLLNNDYKKKDAEDNKGDTKCNQTPGEPENKQYEHHTMPIKMAIHFIITYLQSCIDSSEYVTDEILNVFKTWLYIIYNTRVKFLNYQSFRVFCTQLLFSAFTNNLTVTCYELNHPFNQRLLIKDELIIKNYDAKRDCNNDMTGDTTVTLIDALMGKGSDGNSKRLFDCKSSGIRLCPKAGTMDNIDSNYKTVSQILKEQQALANQKKNSNRKVSGGILKNKDLKHSREEILKETDIYSVHEDDDDDDLESILSETSLLNFQEKIFSGKRKDDNEMIREKRVKFAKKK